VGEHIQVSKSLIDPIYLQRHPNETIDLGNVAVQYNCNGQAYNDTAHAEMRFLPKHDLTFFVPFEGKPAEFALQLFSANGHDGKLTLTTTNLTFEVNCLAAGNDCGGIVFSPRRSGLAVMLPFNAISTATFHLFNFPDFHGPDNYVLLSGEPPLQGSRSCGRAVLNADGWTISIAATDQTHRLVKELKEHGGYVITHMGQIVRDNGDSFTSEHLENVQTCLHYFLSYALGRWAGPALPIGFDVDGNRVFEYWGLGVTARNAWNSSYSCFDVHHAEFLSQLFPGFMSLWNKPLWRTPLCHALYWYLGACEPSTGIGVDTCLILAQTALEGLAWTYCVLDRKMVLPDAFKQRGLTASNKLRLLASSLGIPLEIPAGLTALHAKVQPGWKDSMDAITGIRNSLVHSDAKTQLPLNSYYDAWRLALWYLDLVLMRLCGHQGKYANRLSRQWVGEIEAVPWAK
jgi:hypothetical protein